MKQKFFHLFLALAIIALCTKHYEVAAMGAGGAVFSKMDFTNMISPLAFLQIVPGKFVVTNPGTGLPEEVPYMTRSEKALFDQLITLKRANPVTMDIIMQGGISFDPITYYIRANITGQSGIQDIIDNSIIQTIGVTNIPNGATLAQFYNFCFDRIAVRYASTNTANANVAAMTGWSSVRGSMPAALGNGHLIIQSNQNKVVETPIADFTSVAAITGGGERDYDGGLLEKPRFFLELIGVNLQIAYAKNQLVPSAANTTNAIEIMLYGVQARLKA